MFTYIKMSAEEFDKKLSGGQYFSIVVPNDNFELSLLYKIVIDELHLMFEGPNKDYEKFDQLCNYIWYDSNGRFFLDLSEDPEYTPDKLAFYVSVFDEDIERYEDGLDKDGLDEDDENEEENLVFYDNEEEDRTQNVVDYSYEFYVYSHYKGIMKIELDDAIKLIMSNPIQQI